MNNLLKNAWGFHLNNTNTVNVNNILNLELQILNLIGYAADLTFSLFGALEDTVHFFVDAYDNTFEIYTFFNQEA